MCHVDRVPMRRVLHRVASSVGAVLAAAVIAAVCLVVIGSDGRSIGDVSAGSVLVILAVVTLPMCRRLAHGDDTIARVMRWGFVLKMLGSVVRYRVAIDVYGDLADSALYDRSGAEVAARLAQGFAWPGEFRFQGAGTTHLSYVVGWLYHITGQHVFTGYLVFSWFGFLGYICFYRAAVAGSADVDRLRYARLLFLLPSLLYWPSSVGKEAWMTLMLGVATLGLSTLVSKGFTSGGLFVAAIGLYLAAWVRPHLPLISAVALALAVLVPLGRSVRRRSRFWLVLLTAGALVLSASGIQTFFGSALANDEGDASTVGLLQEASTRTSTGGSEFKAYPVNTPLGVVVGPITVLYRPLPFEVRSPVQLATSLELLFILWLTVKRRRHLAESWRAVRRSTFLRYALFYSAGFVVAFSFIANFGILTRQRAQLWPLALVLLSIRVSSGPAPEPAGDQPATLGNALPVE